MARDGRHAAPEVRAALAGLHLLCAHTEGAIRRHRQGHEAIFRLDEPDHLEAFAQRFGSRLQRCHREFVVVGRVLAVALTDGGVEQGSLLRRVVRTAQALRRVEDGLGQPLGVLAELLLQHLDRHLVLQDAGQHLDLAVLRQAGQQFRVSDADVRVTVDDGLLDLRCAVQQQQSVVQFAQLPAELVGGLLLVASVEPQQIGGALGFLDGARVVSPLVLDDAERARLGIAQVLDGDRHVVGVAVLLAGDHPAAMAVDDLPHPVPAGMRSHHDRALDAIGRLHLLAQVGKGLRVVVLPVVLARHDLPHLKGGLHRPVQRRCVVHWDSFCLSALPSKREAMFPRHRRRSRVAPQALRSTCLRLCLRKRAPAATSPRRMPYRARPHAGRSNSASLRSVFDAVRGGSSRSDAGMFSRAARTSRSKAAR